MLAVGVGNEYLTEAVAGHQAHNLLHPLSIQFVEEVVEQQERRRFRCRALEEVELSQFQRDDKRLVLSLRAFALHGMPTQRELQVVAMDAVERIAHGQVFLAVAPDDLQQRAALAVRRIAQAHSLLSAGDTLVILLEHRLQFADERRALAEQHLAGLRHLFLPQLHEQRVGLRVLLLQQHVALLVGVVVAHQQVDVGAVVL